MNYYETLPNMTNQHVKCNDNKLCQQIQVGGVTYYRYDVLEECKRENDRLQKQIARYENAAKE